MVSFGARILYAILMVLTRSERCSGDWFARRGVGMGNVPIKSRARGTSSMIFQADSSVGFIKQSLPRIQRHVIRPYFDSLALAAGRFAPS